MRRLSSGSFLGRTRRARAERGFAVVETEYRAGTRLPEHAHDRPYLCFVLAGGYEEDACGRAFDCAPGTVIVHGDERSHRDRFGAHGGRCLNVELDAGWFRERASGALRGAGIWHGSPVAAWPLLRRLHASFESAPAGVLLALLARVLEVLAANSRGDDASGWLAGAERALRERWRAPPRLAELARAAGVHPHSLARAFRARFGCPPGVFLRALRTEAAARALLADERPLAEVADALGFCDQSHLTRVFVRQTGTTPGAYRARGR